MAKIRALSVGTTAGSLTEVRAPDSMGWGLQDISSADSGRLSDGANTMMKNRTTQKRKISLAWNDPDGPTAAAILQAFNPEYVWVRYLDAMSNTYEVREFYVGDRSAMLRQITLGGVTYSTLSFDIIER